MSATERDLRQANDKLELWKATAKGLADRVVRAENELAAAKQIMGELCESCGWAMRFPGQPCRCELERELAEAKEYAAYEITQEVHGLREQRDVIMGRLSETHTRMTEAEKQRDRLAVICGELIAAVRINSMRDTFREANREQIEIWLKQWVDKLAAVKGGTP